MDSDEQEVLNAALRRAAALADRDAAALRELMHPRLVWTTFRGDVLNRDGYIAGNTDGALVWREQRFEQPSVTVVGDSAVLVAVVVDDVERDGNQETHRLRLTQTWVRETGAWRCLAGHAGPSL